MDQRKTPSTPGTTQGPHILALLVWITSLTLSPGLVAASAGNPFLDQKTTSYDTDTGFLEYIQFPPNEDPNVALSRAAPTVESSADAVLKAYGRSFGTGTPDTRLKRAGTLATRPSGHTSVKYKQVYKDIPIFAAEVIVDLHPDNQPSAMAGRLPAALNLNTHPVVSAQEASSVAIQRTIKWHGLHPSMQMEATDPVLMVYVPSLVGEAGVPSLVWTIDVSTKETTPVRERVMIDAHSGQVALHYNQVDKARSRMTYSANYTGNLRQTLVCDESSPECSNDNTPDADLAHRYAKDTYDFFLEHHDRDSLDGNGLTLISTVLWDDGYHCPNAFWTGEEMGYCRGAPHADDVVGHELAHGFTQYTSGLEYLNESGAINESLSDMWGEFVDLTNDSGSDEASDRWKMGEDFVGFGAIRNMADPPQFDQPDSMSSPLFYTGSRDNGGVHINSGVNNKAVYLLVDGGRFNGHTVDGIGIEKTSKIYYEAQTGLLTSSSNFADLYNALNQACVNLVGIDNITGYDCNQVLAATNAVEMSLDTTPQGPQTYMCKDGIVPNTVFEDDLENGHSDWAFSEPYGQNPWQPIESHSNWNSGALFVEDVRFQSHSIARLTTPVSVPEGAFAYFDHWYSFEEYYDGGVVEYSIDDGTSWNDLNDLHIDGKTYDQELSSFNPLGERSAFTGDSNGAVSSKYDLSSLAGESLIIRFVEGNDSSVDRIGWIVDNISIYSCDDVVSNAGPDQIVEPGQTVQLDGTDSIDPDGDSQYQWSQVHGPSVELQDQQTLSASFVTPDTDTDLEFQLTLITNDGIKSTDTTSVRVNTPPNAEAGPDRVAGFGEVVTVDGSGSSDPGGDALQFEWSQVSGKPVFIASNSGSELMFTTPNVADVLEFELVVVDAYGATATDRITVRTLGYPVADAGEWQMVEAASVVQLDGSQSSDPDGDIAEYYWEQTSGPDTVLSSEHVKAPTFVAPDSEGELTFRLTVTDDEGLTHSASTHVNVNKEPSSGKGDSKGGSIALQTVLLMTASLVLFRRKAY